MGYQIKNEGGLDMKWVVGIEGKELVVEARYGKVVTSGAGEVLVDGKIAKAWGSSVWGLPKEVSFEIERKPALLRRRGIINQNFDLLVDGRLIKKV